MSRTFPKTIYVTKTEPDEDNPPEYFVDTSKAFIIDDEEDVEVAIYQLVKVGTVKKSSKLVFEK
jgi:hypothetical protein